MPFYRKIIRSRAISELVMGFYYMCTPKNISLYCMTFQETIKAVVVQSNCLS